MTDPAPGDLAPRLDELVDAELIIPIRSSSGEHPDPARLGVDAFRLATDAEGERFIAAFTSSEVFERDGPPGSDHVLMPARDLFERAADARTRVVVDPEASSQLEIEVGVLPFLAAGIDPNRPDALRARRPLEGLQQLEAPDEVPEPLGAALRSALEELPQVERAWLLRAGTGWTAGIALVDDAALAEFDEVRNRLHALATEHLGSRRQLAVTDLRAPAMLERYGSTGAPFFVRDHRPRGFLSRLLDG